MLNVAVIIIPTAGDRVIADGKLKYAMSKRSGEELPAL